MKKECIYQKILITAFGVRKLYTSLYTCYEVAEPSTITKAAFMIHEREREKEERERKICCSSL